MKEGLGQRTGSEGGAPKELPVKVEHVERAGQAGRGTGPPLGFVIQQRHLPGNQLMGGRGVRAHP